ncbi:CaiB/BaiF CoA transferase family protein [Altererythrobacter sp. Z27]|uniref:CaiB/BaiF CoA transferase family protein n=1 Tax=Altererythrobacter sp. Z27 TaxID=3461147 RepID=UPI004044AACD
MSATPRLLEGLRVIDMSTVIFGPHCTQLLADMGADVIKVEPSQGDNFRYVGKPARTRGMGPSHLTINRGKRSVNWDLRSAAGRKALEQLIASGDIFLHNIRADAINRLELDYDSVRAIRPDVIYVHCTGFGLDGPYASYPAYDDVIQAASGTASLLPRVDGNPRPRYLPMALADKVCGLHAAYATLAAVIHRLRTGEGQHVEIPMFETMTSFTLLEHLAGHTFDPPNGPMCYKRQTNPERQPAPTRDGWISIAPYVDERWIAFFDVAGHPEVLEDARLNSPRNRVLNEDYLYARLNAITHERTTAEWLELLSEAGIPAMEVRDVEAIFTDPHLQAVGLFRKAEHPSEGGYIDVRPPVRFSARPSETSRPAPRLGEHNAEVLSELGVGTPDSV